MMEPREKFEVYAKELHYPSVYRPRANYKGREKFEVCFAEEKFEVCFAEEALPPAIRAVHPIRANDRGLVRASTGYAPLISAVEGLDKLAAVLAEAETANLGRDRALTYCPAILLLSVYEYRGRNPVSGDYHGFGLNLMALTVRVSDVRENLRRAIDERWAKEGA